MRPGAIFFPVMIAIASTTSARPGQREMHGQGLVFATWPNLAHSINHAFGGVRHRLVPFRQKFGQNRKILHWMLRCFRVRLNIDNVDRRMPGKILLEVGPGAGQDPTASIETGDRSAEDITGERKRCDVTRGRTSVSVWIDFRSLAPDENSI